MNSKSNFTKKCSQTLARPALYRHSFHREFGFSDTKPTWRGLQGLEPFVVLSFCKNLKLPFEAVFKSNQATCKHKSKQKSILSFWAFDRKQPNGLQGIAVAKISTCNDGTFYHFELSHKAKYPHKFRFNALFSAVCSL